MESLASKDIQLAPPPPSATSPASATTALGRQHKNSLERSDKSSLPLTFRL